MIIPDVAANNEASERKHVDGARKFRFPRRSLQPPRECEKTEVRGHTVERNFAMIPRRTRGGGGFWVAADFQMRGASSSRDFGRVFHAEGNVGQVTLPRLVGCLPLWRNYLTFLEISTFLGTYCSGAVNFLTARDWRHSLGMQIRVVGAPCVADFLFHV